MNITSSAQLSNLAPFAYGRLMQTRAGILKPADGELTGDLAESWEWSPDRLQLSLKIRPGVVWHNIAPVNGRGPFVLADYTPSVGTVWKRNTNYHDKARPYLDLVNEPIISEYAPRALPSFKRGASTPTQSAARISSA